MGLPNLGMVALSSKWRATDSRRGDGCQDEVEIRAAHAVSGTDQELEKNREKCRKKTDPSNDPWN
jgi:hypothetical protein